MGAALSAAILAAWTVSLFTEMGYRLGRRVPGPTWLGSAETYSLSVRLVEGGVVIMYVWTRALPSEDGWYAYRWPSVNLRRAVLSIWPEVDPSGQVSGTGELLPYVRHPLLLSFVVVGIPTVLLFRFDRHRIPPHCCQKCGYNLTGNVSSVCPECGERVAV